MGFFWFIKIGFKVIYKDEDVFLRCYVIFIEGFFVFNLFLIVILNIYIFYDFSW